MKRFKLGFGNRTILEQIAICRRVADGIGKLPAKQRQTVAEHPVVESVAAAADAVAEVELLKTALRAALQKRNDRAAIMRPPPAPPPTSPSQPAATRRRCWRRAWESKKAKQPVGKPGAPTLMRVVSTESEGAVSLRWKRPVRRCVFLIQMTTAPAATRGWKQVAIAPASPAP